MNIGRLVKSLRVSYGWQQKELSERLEISSNYLCLIETGKRNPSADVIEKCAKEFGVSKEALDFLSTSIPAELDPENASIYRKLQENVASLLLFQAQSVA